MGNRAVISLSTSKNAPAIYVHWNGGYASVLAFLTAAKALGLRHVHKGQETKAFESLHGVCKAFLGQSAYLDTYGRSDCDNGDNGVYLIDRELTIIGRKYAPRDEEINPAKTAEIVDTILQRAPIFNA